VRAGGWFEVFEDSALDIEAWVRFAAESCAPVVLAGHSFGSLRAVYYLARPATARVDALVLGSFSFGLRHLESGVAARAEELVSVGRGEDLLPPGSWGRGFGTDTVSAQTYASWWRVAPGFFEEPAVSLAAVGRPTFVWYGTKGDVGGDAEAEWLRERLSAAPFVETALLDEVSHGYEGGEETIAEAICNRLARLVGSIATTP
jgi:pimeloyl-ACP methyl ester carboxylesterase